MAFNEKLPKWDNVGVEPPESKKTEGWQPTEKPPAQWFNWIFNRIYKVVEELQGKSVEKGIVGSLVDLTTTIKTSIVNSINWLKGDLDAHKAEKVSKVVTITRDLSLAGTQVIGGIGFKPKTVIAFATVGVTLGKQSVGFCDENLLALILADYGAIASGTYVANPGLVKIFNTEANNTFANVQSFDADGLTLIWDKLGTGATGTCSINLLLTTH